MDNYEYEDCSFIKGAFYTIYGLGVVVGGFVFMLWISSWFLKPDDYTPPEKSKVKIEQIKSTTPVINHDVTVETNITVSDGVTSREVTVNSLNDSLSPNDVTLLGEAFGEMAYTAAKDRQSEIDNNKEYYTKRIKNEDQ